MTIAHYMQKTQRRLEKAGIGTARLDCLVLLEDATGKDRAYLLAHPERPLQGATLKKLEQQIERRAQHVPLAQIRGKTEFYGREFIITPDVLEPRPESETMIELAKEIYRVAPCNRGEKCAIVDLGTGSGALAITAKLELPNSEAIATDIDKRCLKVAETNATKHKTDITFYDGDLLGALPPTVYGLPSIFLCNLPYVPNNFTVNKAALAEPKHAIYGGKDGLDLYRRLFEQISSSTTKPLYVLTESLPPQHTKLAKIAVKAGYKQTRVDDFIQVFKQLT
jgi:release factor glutamine methyltransferase